MDKIFIFFLHNELNKINLFDLSFFKNINILLKKLIKNSSPIFSSLLNS